VSGQPASSPPPATPAARPGKRRDLPIFSSLTGYQTAWLVADVIAGITLVAIAIPEQMATAQLAGMPVQTGLYAFIAGGLAIAIFGSSRQMSVGADSTIAPIFAAGVAGLAAAGTAEYFGLTVFLALIVGAMLVVIGLLKMGWIADLLAVPVTTGFLAGIGITIIVGQLPDIFGVPKGTGGMVDQVVSIFQDFSAWNWYSVAIAAVVLAIVLVSEKINPKIPGALIGLILSLIAVSVFDLTAKDVAVLGTLPQGLPAVALPQGTWDQLIALIPIALTVVLVCLMQTAATSRSFADLGGYEVNMNKDFLALGLGSVGAAFVGSFPVDSSPPRTAVVAQSGGRSQVASLVAVGVIVLIILFATAALADLPKATLGAILAYVGSRIIRLKAIREIWPFDRIEFGLAVFTLLAVVFVGTEFGILVAIVLAILERTRISARPPIMTLGRIAGTTSWVPIAPSAPTAAEVPGVKVFAFTAPLYFANANTFRDRVRELAIETETPPAALVLDAEGIDDIDFTGAASVAYVAGLLEKKGVAFGIARLHTEQMPEAVTPERLGLRGIQVFPTVEAAVEALKPKGG
jgi:high affinity sulfate transporter 1